MFILGVLWGKNYKKEKKCCPVMRVIIKTTPNKHFWEYLFEETGEKLY